MTLEKTYESTRFSEVAIRSAVAKFDELFKNRQNLDVQHRRLVMAKGNQTWRFDKEDDFFTHYSDCDSATYHREISQAGKMSSAEFTIVFRRRDTTIVSVETNQDCLKAGRRGSILAVFQVLTEYEDECRLPQKTTELDSKPVIFIGHGRSQAWRDLKDHLTDKHDYRVEAYEAGARAGHTIRDILESMLKNSSFALLVLTKEDATADGGVRARQNVIHETGLFQGKLGFSRAIVLLESGTEDFTNISGIEQLRFTKIQETFGDIIATLKREFN